MVTLAPPDGRTSGLWALAFGAVAALAAIVATLKSDWSAVGRWAALVAIGQGAALSWVDAGPGVHFQHLRLNTLGESGVSWLAIGVLLIQAVVVGTWGRPALRRTFQGARRYGSPLAWLILGFVVFLTGAALSREPAFYVAELFAALTLQALALASLLGACDSLTPAQAARIRDSAVALVESPRLPGMAAVWVTGASTLLAVLVYQLHPHVPDEVVYLLQAQYFAQGLLELPLPMVPAAFEMDLVSYDVARWYVPVPPGWPAALAVGVRLGIPWLVNPILAGLSVLLVHRFVRQVYDARTAGVVTCLLASSPWFLFLNMSLMTHAFTLFAAASAAFATGRAIKAGSWGWSVLAGCALGVVALNRPLEGLIAAVSLGLWALFASRESRSLSQRARDVGLMAVFSAAVVATTFPYNAHFTGDPLVFPIMTYADQIYGEGANSLGFGPDKGLGFGGLDPFPGHGIADVLVNSALNFFQINVELSGWTVGSTLPVALLLLVAGGWVWADLGMVLAILLVVGAHAFYWFSGGPDFGARYWYLALVPLLVLVARASTRLAQLAPQSGRVAFGVALLCLTSLFVFMPWRANDKYWQYRGMEPGIRALAAEHQWGPDDLILVRGDRHPDYASVVVYNPVDLRGEGPLYAWDRGQDVREALVDAYPNRRMWSVDGPTISGAGFVLRTRPSTEEEGP